MGNMISNYDELLKAAASQEEPQRLLFVFASTELPEDHSETEAERFNQGEGGAITPVICVDKHLNELSNFADLVSEAAELDAPWSIVIVACLSGKGGIPASDSDADTGLKNMVSAIQSGMISNFMAFDKDGHPLDFY
ncbi:MAG: hypothetical protein KAG18_08325 [Sinobacterium sp.]|nr:hypothetical protein [Sinobacterium sp.]